MHVSAMTPWVLSENISIDSEKPERGKRAATPHIWVNGRGPSFSPLFLVS